MVFTESFNQPKAQEFCRTEIMKSIEKQGKIMEDDCPYLRSFILESSRCFPIMSLESIFDASGIN